MESKPQGSILLDTKLERDLALGTYLLIDSKTEDIDRCSPNWVTKAEKSLGRNRMHRCMLTLIDWHVKCYANLHFSTNASMSRNTDSQNIRTIHLLYERTSSYLSGY